MDSVAPWKLHIARLNRERAGHLEPPILERVTAISYRLAGGERLWIPRTFSILFWITGGIFLYQLALRMIPWIGATVGVAYYLFNPLGVHVSIGFLPDPLMIGLLSASLLAIVRCRDHPTRGRRAAATVLSALAILVKPFALFPVVGVAIALAVHDRGFGRRMLDRPTLLFLAGIITPAVVYYTYAIVLHPLILQAGTEIADTPVASIQPHLLLQREYWTSWIGTATAALGPAPLVASLVGVPLVRTGEGRALLLGLLAGYVLHCMTFTYHIRFASYYHLQLLIAVALSLGQIIAVITRELRHLLATRLWWALPVAACLLMAFLTGRAIRQEAGSDLPESPQLAREIGALIGHSDRAVLIAGYYGTPLQYYGEFAGVFWPRPIRSTDRTRQQRVPRSVAARLADLGFEPEYFVVTNLPEYRRHHADLEEFLEANCQMIAMRPAYLIYGKCDDQLGSRMGTSAAVGSVPMIDGRFWRRPAAVGLGTYHVRRSSVTRGALESP